MNITVRYNDHEIRDALKRLDDDAPLAVARALNRTIGTVRTSAVKLVAENVGITQRDVRGAMEIDRASRSQLVARLQITGRRIPLIRFRARQTTRGVTYRLAGGRSLAPSAFIVTMPSGHEGVFKRRGRGRLPIDELKGPSLPRVFTRAVILSALKTVARSVMVKNLAHEVRFLLSKRGERSEAA